MVVVVKDVEDCLWKGEGFGFEYGFLFIVNFGVF